MTRALPFLLAALGAFAAFTIAFAHAEPVRVSPGDGAMLGARPSQVEIEMSQEMARQAGANEVDVFDQSGNEVTAVGAVIDNSNRRKISVPLPADLRVGTYTVKWRTLSADDGDPANGQMTFTYDPGQPPAPGKQVLREDLAATASPGPAAQAAEAPRTGGGRSWVLVVAVGIGGVALGAGATFLLVQKQS